MNSKLLLFNNIFSAFDSSENSIIRFGRKKHAEYNIDVCFNEESTSRLHCTIAYDGDSHNWRVVDSNGIKKSLNGTWFLADDPLVVYSCMMIRVGTTTFEALVQ